MFVYQIDSYGYWEKQLSRNDFTLGQFGENFTVEGLADDIESCAGEIGDPNPRSIRFDVYWAALSPAAHADQNLLFSELVVPNSMLAQMQFQNMKARSKLLIS